MMRGEIEAPASTPGGERGERWGATPQQTWEKAQKEAVKKAKADALGAENEKKEAERARLKQIEDGEKLLKRLKKELAQLEELKEKEWDELTEEDEAQLEGEVDLRKRIADLENGGGC